MKRIQEWRERFDDAHVTIKSFPMWEVNLTTDGWSATGYGAGPTLELAWAAAVTDHAEHRVEKLRGMRDHYLSQAGKIAAELATELVSERDSLESSSSTERAATDSERDARGAAE